MQCDPSMHGKGTKELLRQLCIKGTDHWCHGNIPGIIDEKWAAADIQCDKGKGLVHRKIERTISRYAAFIAKSSMKCLPQRNADILNGVMSIDFDISIAFHMEIKLTMRRKECQHVVEEANTGGNL